MSPAPRAEEVIRGQEEYRQVYGQAPVSSPGLIVTLSSDSESSRGIGSRTSTPRGERSITASPEYSPPDQFQRNISFFVTGSPQAEAAGSSSVAQVAQAAGSGARSSVLIPKEARLNPAASVFRPFGINQQVPLNPPASVFAAEPEKNKTPSLELSALAALNDAVAAWTPVVNNYLPPPAPTFVSNLQVTPSDQRSAGRPVAEVTRVVPIVAATRTERRFVPISPVATTPSAGPVRRPEPRHFALRTQPAPDMPLQSEPAAVVEISVVPVAGVEAPPVPVAEAPRVPNRAVRLGDVTPSGNVRPIVARFNYPVSSRFTDARIVGRIKKIQSFSCECFNEATRCVCSSATYRCELTVEVKLRAGTQQ